MVTFGETLHTPAREVWLPELHPGMTLLDGALAWVGAGWHVLPTVPGEKRPDVGAGWEERASNDPEMLRRWFTRPQPGRGLGVAPGRSKAVILDIDTPEEFPEHYAAAIPQEMRSYTRADKSRYHAAFMLPPQTTCGSGAMKGGDVRSSGGFVMTSPSVHPATGRRYPAPAVYVLPELPEALYGLLRPVRPKGDTITPGEAGKLLESILWLPGVAVEGERRVLYFENDLNEANGRHNTLVRHLCRVLRDGHQGVYDPRPAVAGLRAAWLTYWRTGSGGRDVVVEFDQALAVAVRDRAQQR